MAESTGKTVLIVEDNAVNLELVTDLLAVAGYRVVTATTAPAGIRLAQTVRPDLVLMDVSLPGMDGLQATRRLKEDPATAAIPVVAVTAQAMAGDKERALAAGCVGHITKPIDTRQFAGQVAEYMTR